jgi:hypothetical protein
LRKNRSPASAKFRIDAVAMATCGHDVSGPLRGPQFDVVLQAGGGGEGGGGQMYSRTFGISDDARRLRESGADVIGDSCFPSYRSGLSS